MQYLFTFIVSLVISMMLVPPLIKLAPAIGAIDLPDARKVHQQAIPRIGGIAMIIGVIVPIIFWLPMETNIVSLLLAYAILLFFGVWDDRSDIHYRIKFLGQFLAVILVVTLGDVVVYKIPFVDVDLPEYIAIPFTIFALVGITNAINLSDGLDGLAGGTTLLTFCMVALLAYKSESYQLLLICLAVAGSVIGFLRHNTYPARIFMGDTGSQFLGFSAGVLVIVLSQQANTAMSPAIPLFLLGLPIIDTLAVMSQRLYEKRSPFSPDKNHIHHKLLDIGFDHYEAVFAIYIFQTLLVAMSLFMIYESDALIMLSYIAISGMVLYLFRHARRTNWHLHRSAETDSKFRQLIVSVYNTGLLEAVPGYILKYGIAGLFLVAAAFAGTVNTDIASLAAILLGLAMIAVFSRQHRAILEKIVTYVLCALVVYQLNADDFIRLEYSEILNIFFALLAVAFAIKIRFSKNKNFQITPLDFLVILLVIAVPNLPEFADNDLHIGESALMLIVLFYCSEAVLNIIKTKYDVFKLGIIASLLLITLRGFV